MSIDRIEAASIALIGCDSMQPSGQYAWDGAGEITRNSYRFRAIAAIKAAESLPLIVYGACYQDPHEPWGWAVAKLYARRADAASHVARECVRNIEAWSYVEADDQEAAEFVNDCHEVIEYEVG